MNIQTNSKKIKSGDIFVALKGEHYDGHDYIDEAIRNGARKLIVEKEIVADIDVEVVTDTTEYLKNYLSNYYQKHLSSLNLIGITGTNGKTTTAYLTYQILRKLNHPVAYIGTIGFYLDDKMKDLPNTTPDILSLYQLLLEAKKHHINTVIMEVSSHGLVQERMYGLLLTMGAFTNLSQDHLDYHKTMQDYLQAKMKILQYLKPNAKMIINQDDKQYSHFLDSHNLLFGYSGKDYQIKDCKVLNNQMIFTFYHKKDYTITLPFIGLYNAYNYLMALILVHQLHFSIESILSVSNDLVLPQGRCYVIPYKQGSIIIDFAHTPDAILNVLKTFPHAITVIGCGGNRDQQKRPMIAEIATSYSDHVIFTSDNPRNEDPYYIIQDMIKGIKRNNYEIIIDRKLAIFKALSQMKESDTVLILGKGHENYLLIQNKKIPFEDKKVVFEYIQNHPF